MSTLPTRQISGDVPLSTSPCTVCGTPGTIPTDPDGRCERCLIVSYGFDPDDGLYVGWLYGEQVMGDKGWSGYCEDWIGRSVDTVPSDDRPRIIATHSPDDIEIIEILVARAFRADLQFYFEITWTPLQGLRHAICFYPNADPGIWGQLSQAKSLLAFAATVRKDERGRRRDTELSPVDAMLVAEGERIYAEGGRTWPEVERMLNLEPDRLKYLRRKKRNLS